MRKLLIAYLVLALSFGILSGYAEGSLIASSIAVPTPEDISSDKVIDMAKGVLCETESINISD
ncbi:MAG: hypothetical protein RR296_13360, partial [Clostridia bacterium]